MSFLSFLKKILPYLCRHLTKFITKIVMSGQFHTSSIFRHPPYFHSKLTSFHLLGAEHRGRCLFGISYALYLYMCICICICIFVYVYLHLCTLFTWWGAEARLALAMHCILMAPAPSLVACFHLILIPILEYPSNHKIKMLCPLTSWPMCISINQPTYNDFNLICTSLCVSDVHVGFLVTFWKQNDV